MRIRVLAILFVLSVAAGAFGAPAALLRWGTDKPEPLMSFSWGVSNPAAIATKATTTPFTFVKAISASSRAKFDACNTAQHFPQVTIDLMDGKGNTIAQVKLSDVVVMSYTVGNGDPPVETVTLGYTRADYFVVAAP